MAGPYFFAHTNLANCVLHLNTPRDELAKHT
jgi:hypothetical protein